MVYVTFFSRNNGFDIKTEVERSVVLGDQKVYSFFFPFNKLQLVTCGVKFLLRCMLNLKFIFFVVS